MLTADGDGGGSAAARKGEGSSGVGPAGVSLAAGTGNRSIADGGGTLACLAGSVSGGPGLRFRHDRRRAQFFEAGIDFENLRQVLAAQLREQGIVRVAGREHPEALFLQREKRVLVAKFDVGIDDRLNGLYYRFAACCRMAVHQLHACEAELSEGSKAFNQRRL